jgi:signal transduction histidine kinase
MRLRTTLFGLLVVISIVLAGTVYAGFSLHKADLATQEADALNLTAETVAQDIDARLAEKRTAVTLTAAQPAVADHGSTGQRGSLERLLATTGIDGASVVAANGTMVAIVGPNLTDERRTALVGRDFGDRTYVRRALAGQVYTGDPLHAESGNYIVTISAPIERNGSVVGTVNGALHLREANFFAQSHAFLDSTQGLHLSMGGETLDIGAGSGPVEGNATATVDSTGWTVLVDRHGSPVATRVWYTSLFQALAVVLAVLSVALVGVWLERTTITQLEDLIAGLGRLEDGDYETSIDLGVTDEWNRISSQFNALAETLRQRESQLRVLNRVLRHNLRNDMSVVVAHADTLLQDDLEAETREKVTTIRHTATGLIETSEHARAIYEELLSNEDRDSRPVDLVAVVATSTDDLRAAHPEASIETRLPDAAWVEDGEATPIVVEELCRNGLVHNDLPPADRELQVEVGNRDDGTVELHVIDNGPGLPAGEVELLTGKREETEVDHGSGLGLWLVQWLVDQRGGSISLRRRGDRGTSVTVRVPAGSPPQSPAVGSAADPESDDEATDGREAWRGAAGDGTDEDSATSEGAPRDGRGRAAGGDGGSRGGRRRDGGR